MGICVPRIFYVKKKIWWSILASKDAASNSNALISSLDVPKGYFAVYIGKGVKKRFVVPISYLCQPLFQELLNQAEEESGFDNPLGGLTIPCSQDIFIDITSCLN